MLYSLINSLYDFRQIVISLCGFRLGFGLRFRLRTLNFDTFSYVYLLHFYLKVQIIRGLVARTVS